MQRQTKGTTLIQDHGFVKVLYKCIQQCNSITLEGADRPNLPGMVALKGLLGRNCSGANIHQCINICNSLASGIYKENYWNKM